MMIPNAEKTFPMPAMTPCIVASRVSPPSRPKRTEPPISVKNGETLYRILTTVISAMVMTNAMSRSIELVFLHAGKNKLGVVLTVDPSKKTGPLHEDKQAGG